MLLTLGDDGAGWRGFLGWLGVPVCLLRAGSE